MTNAELKDLLRERDVQIKELKREVRELKKLLVEKARSKDAKPPKEAANYSVARYEQKQRKRQHKNSTGRKPKDAKRQQATETIDLYWHGAKQKKCELRREQFVWRLIDGKATYTHYRIFDSADSSELPPVDGVRNGKCEYGMEVLITLAYLTYWTGMSMDKACAILNFFSGLKLSKSQADSLLSQLAADWQIEYDTIGELIALAAVLYIDASRLESRQAVVLHMDLQHAFDRAVQMWRRSRQGRAERRAGEKVRWHRCHRRLQRLPFAIRRTPTLLGTFPPQGDCRVASQSKQPAIQTVSEITVCDLLRRRARESRWSFVGGPSGSGKPSAIANSHDLSAARRTDLWLDRRCEVRPFAKRIGSQHGQTIRVRFAS